MPKRKPTGNRNVDRHDRYLVSIRATYTEKRDLQQEARRWAALAGLPAKGSLTAYVRNRLGLSDPAELKESDRAAKEPVPARA